MKVRKSDVFPGLWLTVEAPSLTFRYGMAWVAFQMKDGQAIEVDCSDRGFGDSAVLNYVHQKAREYAQAQKKKAAASTAAQGSEALEIAS